MCNVLQFGVTRCHQGEAGDVNTGVLSLLHFTLNTIINISLTQIYANIVHHSWNHTLY